MPSAYSLSSLMVKNRILVAEDLPVIFSPTSISALISVVTLPCRGTGLELTFREEQPDIAPATRRVDAISAFFTKLLHVLLLGRHGRAHYTESACLRSEEH